MFTYGDTFELLGLTWHIQDIRDWEDQDVPFAERATITPIGPTGEWATGEVRIGRGSRSGVRLEVRAAPEADLVLGRTSATGVELSETQRKLIRDEMFPLLHLPRLSDEDIVERQVSFIVSRAASAAGDVTQSLYRVPPAVRGAHADRILDEATKAFRGKLAAAFVADD